MSLAACLLLQAPGDEPSQTLLPLMADFREQDQQQLADLQGMAKTTISNLKVSFSWAVRGYDPSTSGMQAA